MRLLHPATALVFIISLGTHAAADTHLSPLAPPPDWKTLDAYQEQITYHDFKSELRKVYAPNRAYHPFIKFNHQSASILTTSADKDAPRYNLRFTDSKTAPRRPNPRYWRRATELGPAPSGHPLTGLKIAIDPGHIGGSFAKTEERWFQIGDSRPVTEGDMTLQVAHLLKPGLEALGATVSLVRTDTTPVTSLRPTDLRKQAKAVLLEKGIARPGSDYKIADDPNKRTSVRWQSELLFYRTAEIRERASLINKTIRPDITLVLHFNAEPWGNPLAPSLAHKNHLHVLVNGTYSEGELALDDVRLDMLTRLAEGIHSEELAISTAVAESMAAVTGLSPYSYEHDNARRTGSNPYIWARNLLANRIYRNPVIYVEPYVMNSSEAHARIQAGDYPGTRLILGKQRPSIFREYSQSLIDGLTNYYRDARD